MTSTRMGRQYVEEARSRTELVRLALERGLWSTVLRFLDDSLERGYAGEMRYMACVRPRPVVESIPMVRASVGRGGFARTRRAAAQPQRAHAPLLTAPPPGILGAS